MSFLKIIPTLSQLWFRHLELEVAFLPFCGWLLWEMFPSQICPTVFWRRGHTGNSCGTVKRHLYVSCMQEGLTQKTALLSDSYFDFFLPHNVITPILAQNFTLSLIILRLITLRKTRIPLPLPPAIVHCSSYLFFPYLLFFFFLFFLVFHLFKTVYLDFSPMSD